MSEGGCLLGVCEGLRGFVCVGVCVFRLVVLAGVGIPERLLLPKSF